MRESREREVSLPHFNSRTLERVLDYIYFQSVYVGDIEFGLELCECARFRALRNLEDAVLNVLIMLADSSNCCTLLVVSEKHGFSELEVEALVVIDYNFLRLSESNPFANVSIDLMEKVVTSDTLRVRGELDVLNAIITLADNHGHEVEKDLMERLSSESGDDNMKVGKRSVEHVSVLEVMQLLVHHVSLDELSAFHLRAVGRLSLEAHLDKLSSFCFEKLLVNGPLPLLSAPIPHLKRCTHVRSLPVFSFAFPVYGVSSIEEETKHMTPWAVSPFRNWKLCCIRRLKEKDNEVQWVSRYLDVDGHGARENFIPLYYQFFVHDPKDISHIKYTQVFCGSRSQLSNGGLGVMLHSQNLHLPMSPLIHQCQVSNS